MSRTEGKKGIYKGSGKTVSVDLKQGKAPWQFRGGGALLLTLTNLICINLAGIPTFVLEGIHRATWCEQGRAKKTKRIAILFWLLPLVALGVLITLW